MIGTSVMKELKKRRSIVEMKENSQMYWTFAITFIKPLNASVALI